ncbi:hypothetical protein DQ354_14850 [Arthrobacter sp. AQ5-06]|nr:hypothetical protein DQ354_14850 [Arthrobacter sp. AQ5-06]
MAVRRTGVVQVGAGDGRRRRGCRCRQRGCGGARESGLCGCAPSGGTPRRGVVDFECEACRAAEPLVAELKEDYGDRITFIHRYFPLPGRLNSGTAALAAEAAARQGRYTPMVTKLFETQPEWGEKQDSQAALFRAYAEGLGLDMARFDQDVVAEDTKERIRRDIADGKAMGVSGTPAFFLNGEKITLNTAAQFRQLLDDAAR